MFRVALQIFGGSLKEKYLCSPEQPFASGHRVREQKFLNDEEGTLD
jgi:hypothetical protein